MTRRANPSTLPLLPDTAPDAGTGTERPARELTPEEKDDALSVVQEWWAHHCLNGCGECGVYEEFCHRASILECETCESATNTFASEGQSCPQCGKTRTPIDICICLVCGCCRSEVVEGFICGDNVRLDWCWLDSWDGVPLLHETEDQARECVMGRLDQYRPPKEETTAPARKKATRKKQQSPSAAASASASAPVSSSAPSEEIPAKQPALFG